MESQNGNSTPNHAAIASSPAATALAGSLWEFIPDVVGVLISGPNKQLEQRAVRKASKAVLALSSSFPRRLLRLLFRHKTRLRLVALGEHCLQKILRTL